PPSVPFPFWPAAHPAPCSCRPSASGDPSPPASDRP
ncbi:HTH lysR-type domain-containing protein, partial [Dysosmobacter welbionis]